MKILYTFLVSLPIIFAVDMIWLGYFAKDYYAKLMAPVVSVQFNWVAAILFYLFYFIGIYIFVLVPGIDSRSLLKTAYMGALFGFFCYMTYDMTNLATVKDWPLKLAVVDILWGVFLTTFTSVLAYKVYFWLS